jgi:hypothetical protein
MYISQAKLYFAKIKIYVSDFIYVFSPFLKKKLRGGTLECVWK